MTLDPRPLYSPVVTVHVTPRITLHVRSAGHTGLYRLYGTVSPARPGAHVIDPAADARRRPNSKRERAATRTRSARTALKKATTTLSRFSVIVEPQRHLALPRVRAAAEGRARVGRERQRADPGAAPRNGQTRH